jgi:hypothetical protein
MVARITPIAIGFGVEAAAVKATAVLAAQSGYRYSTVSGYVIFYCGRLHWLLPTHFLQDKDRIAAR